MPDPRHPAPAPTDEALVARIRARGIGDRDAWGELLARYQDPLFAICLRMCGNRETAADLTQDAMVKILQGLDSFDAKSRLSTWMYRVAVNTCLTHRRSDKLRRHASLDEHKTSDTSELRYDAESAEPAREQVRELSPGQRVQHHERQQAVSAALTSLPPEQRAILVLRDVQGLEYDQIAAALSLELGTVKSRLFRARAALRNAIESQSPES